MKAKNLVTITLMILLLSSLWYVALSSSLFLPFLENSKLLQRQHQDRTLYLGNSQGLHPGIKKLLPKGFVPVPVDHYQKEISTLTPHEILEIQSLTALPHVELLLKQWDTQWRENPPLYTNGDIVLSLYLLNPTTSEAWQIVYPPDAEKLIALLSTVETVSRPDLGMESGMLIATPGRDYYHYIPESSLVFQGEKISEFLAPLKKRALLGVDLFQLLSGNDVMATQFIGYRKKDNNQLEKITLDTTHPEVSEEVLRIFRRVRVEEGVFSQSTLENTPALSLEDGHYSLSLSLAPPYESQEKLEVMGYPFAFLTTFTRQENRLRTYSLSQGSTQALLEEIAQLPEAQLHLLEDPREDTHLPPELYATP